MRKLYLTFLFILLLPVLSWAADWYVGDFVVGATHGDNSGSSFANRWNGLSNVVWGGSGVKAGDTLWLCGPFGDATVDGEGLTNYSRLTVGASGAATGIITIRGDCTNAPDVDARGYIGVLYCTNTGYTGNWTETAEAGVYSHSVTGFSGWMYEVTGSPWTVYTQQITISSPPSAPELASFTAGSFGYDSINKVLYVKTPSGTSPNTNHQVVVGGQELNISSHDYITVKYITIYGGTSYESSANYINYDHVNSINNAWAFQLSGPCRYNSFFYVTITNAGEGIYTVKNASGFSDYLTVDHCTISGVKETNLYGTGSDCHSIGMQGGVGCIVSNNTISDGNSGVYYYNSAGYSNGGCTVRNNYIDNIWHGSTVAHGEAICTEGNNAGVVTFVVYNNIVTNSYVGIGCRNQMTGATMATIENNTLYHNQVGLHFAQTNSGIPAFIKNNIVSTPFDYGIVHLPVVHVYAYDSSTYKYASWNFTCDYNNYYPAGVFYFDDSSSPWPGHATENFATWSGHIGGQEANSNNNTDPMWANGSGLHNTTTDFKLTAASPAAVRDGGYNVGLYYDYFHYPVPAGAGYPMGAVEFTNVYFTTYCKNKVLDHICKVASYSPESTVYLALFTADPTVAGTLTNEADYTGYERQAITFSAASDRAVIQNGTINFPYASAGSNVITHWGIMDSDVEGAGNMLAFGSFSASKTVEANKRPVVADAEVVIEFTTGGLSTGYANSILDWLFRAQALSQPTNIYAALTSTASTDAALGTELSGDGYARATANSWAAASGGSTSNSAAITFNKATAAWVAAVSIGLLDDSTGGTYMMYAPTDVTVTNQGTLTYPAGYIKINLQ